MSGQDLPPDILHTIYQCLDSLDTCTISSAALVSRAFNCIFHAYLYKHLVVARTGSRIPSLIKTLERSPALRNTIQSLTVRFHCTSPKVTKFLRRVFKSPPNHFHRFVQFIIKTHPTDLQYLVLVGSKPGNKNFNWDTLKREEKAILLSLRCGVPSIRGVRVVGINRLNRDIVKGSDESSSLHALHIYSTSLLPTHCPTSPLPAPSSSFCKLETLHIDQPRAAYEDVTEGLYTLVVESGQETLRRVHLRAIPEFIGRGEDEFLEDAPFCVDFRGHTILETVVVSSYLPSLPPSMTHDKAVELLKPYYTHVLASEIAAMICLRSIVKLPPSLALLRIHIHLVISDTQLDEALQIQSGRVEGSVLQWDLRMLDGHLVNTVRRSTGGELFRVELGVQFVPPLASDLG